MDTQEYIDDQMIRTAAAQAHAWFPGLTSYAPTVGITSLPKRPDVAGYYDAASKSVQVNAARASALKPNQLAGLIALERTRGHLSSVEGQPWLEQFPLSDEQRQWWKKFYINTAGDAPSDAASQDKIMKATILSRLMVGDTLPSGAPALSPTQIDVANQLHQHYRTPTP